MTNRSESSPEPTAAEPWNADDSAVRYESWTHFLLTLASCADLEDSERARLRLLAEELESAEPARGEAFAPGDWICDTCGYIESRRVLHVPSGEVTASETPAYPCPNDGQFMRRYTWREMAKAAQQRALEEIEARQKVEQEREEERADFWAIQAAMSEIKLLVPLNENTDGPKSGWAGVVQRVRDLVRETATLTERLARVNQALESMRATLLAWDHAEITDIEMATMVRAALRTAGGEANG